MKRILFTTFLIIFLFPGAVFSQRDSVRNVFLDAESWFLFEEYAEALPLYMGLLQNDPGNDNLKYKIGICLLNDPYQKHLSIKYLTDASANINQQYKENSIKETTAPPDVLFYLGNAYLVNELMDRAIESYEQFMKIMDRDVYDEELVQAQIRACNNAKRLKTMPVDFDLTLLDSLINTRYADIHPVISGDGSKLAFVTELPFYDGAFFCEKTGEGWSYPQSITQSLGFDADIYPTGLSHDGTEMILYYDDDYIGNLYYSKYEDGRWLPATKMDENISTKYWESHGSFSKDGQTLYFTSNRKGSNGGLDIYTSKRQSDGKWGVPENLGPTINSTYNEETPFISADGQTLYFSSYGHFNIGGYDIFYSKKNADGTWGDPVNLGYPINTTDDDLFFQPVNNGVSAYYSLYSPSGRGDHDIYYMDIYPVDNPRIYLVSGTLRTGDGPEDNSRIAIFVVDSQTGDTITLAEPDHETGAFSFNLKQGLYELHFSGDGYEDLIKPLHITPKSNKGGIKLANDILLALVKKEPVIFEGEESRIGLEDTLYGTRAGETIVVPVEEAIRLIEEEESLGGPDQEQLELTPSILDDASGAQLNELQGDAILLQKTMLENAEGPLKEYLENLDLETEGIETPEDLIMHLEEVSAKNGFSAEEIRKAMLNSMGQAPEPEGLDKEPGKQKDRKGWPAFLMIGAGAGFLWLILWWRRRKNDKKSA